MVKASHLKHPFSSTCSFIGYITQSILSRRAISILSGGTLMIGLRPTIGFYMSFNHWLLVSDKVELLFKGLVNLLPCGDLIYILVEISGLLVCRLPVLSAFQFAGRNYPRLYHWISWASKLDRLMRLTLSPQLVTSGSAFTENMSIWPSSPYKIMISPGNIVFRFFLFRGAIFLYASTYSLWSPFPFYGIATLPAASTFLVITFLGNWALSSPRSLFCWFIQPFTRFSPVSSLLQWTSLLLPGSHLFHTGRCRTPTWCLLSWAFHVMNIWAFFLINSEWRIR